MLDIIYTIQALKMGPKKEQSGHRSSKRYVVPSLILQLCSTSSMDNLLTPLLETPSIPIPTTRNPTPATKTPYHHPPSKPPPQTPVPTHHTPHPQTHTTIITTPLSPTLPLTWKISLSIPPIHLLLERIALPVPGVTVAQFLTRRQLGRRGMDRSMS